MQRPLKEAEYQFLNSYVDLRRFHNSEIPKRKTYTANLGIIIQKRPHLFKDNISVDKADFRPYRTIVLQPPQTKRLTQTKFFEKRLKKTTQLLNFYCWEKTAFIETAIIS